METPIADFVLSQRGQRMLVINDHKFRKRKVLKTGNEIMWICSVRNCNARCYTFGGKFRCRAIWNGDKIIDERLL